MTPPGAATESPLDGCTIEAWASRCIASGPTSPGPGRFAVADLPGLVRIVKRTLKKIQYRPHLNTGCLAETWLTLDTPAKT